MRAREFLFEYKRDITAQRLGSKLIRSGEREGITDVDKILTALEEMDPTTNKQYTVWLANQYIANKFRLEDERIGDLLTWFHTNKATLDQKDIGQYDISSLGDTYSKYNQQVFSADKQEEEKARAESEVMYESGKDMLVGPKTEFAAQYWGRGSDWCTSYGDPKGKWPKRTCQFNRYMADYNKAPIYIWRVDDRPQLQFHFPSRQFMDAADRAISAEKLNYFRTQHPITKKLFALKEKEIAKDTFKAYRYARRVIRGRFPEGEAAIAKDPEWAYNYARYVILGGFPEGEAAIAKDPEWAYNYARYVIHGRFPEAEATIAKDPEYAYLYAKDIIRGRWPEAEATITKDPSY
jgi:hypothetical protein